MSETMESTGDHDSSSISTSLGQDEKDFRSWSDLPMDILRLISSRVAPSAQPHFSAVCKRWWQSSSIVYPADICPLLMHFKRNKHGACHYYSPFINKTLMVDCYHDLAGTQFHFAKDGWLLLSRDKDLMMVNPLTKSKYELPRPERPIDFCGIAFTCSPTSPDHTIFAIDYLDVYVRIWMFRQGSWKDTFHMNSEPFEFSYSNPVFHQGLFYCLGINGKLGVFDPFKYTWTVLQKPGKLVDNTYKGKGFLVELEGELWSALIDDGKPVRLFRLNRASMEWEKAIALRDRMMYVGCPMPLLMIAQRRQMKNKIYNSRFRQKPEVVRAEVRRDEGRIYFVVERAFECELSECKGKDSDKQGNICCYSMESDQESVVEYQNFFRYLCSMWLEPKLDE